LVLYGQLRCPAVRDTQGEVRPDIASPVGGRRLYYCSQHQVDGTLMTIWLLLSRHFGVGYTPQPVFRTGTSLVHQGGNSWAMLAGTIKLCPRELHRNRHRPVPACSYNAIGSFLLILRIGKPEQNGIELSDNNKRERKYSFPALHPSRLRWIALYPAAIRRKTIASHGPFRGTADNFSRFGW
jgi:hypothetical protein